MESATSLEIQTLLIQPEEECLEAFALRAGLLGIGLLPHPASELVEAARNWLAANLPDIRAAICRNQRVRSLCTIPPGEESRLHLALAISEVLGHHIVKQPGVAPLSVLCVKMGVEKLCRECWL